MFEDVIVDIVAAIICFSSSCHPILVGRDTPTGVFQLVHYSTDDPLYGGDILSFKETDSALYAIHRVIDVPGQQRLLRIRSSMPERRIFITNGCINVESEVFQQLVDCCYSSKLIIR